MANNTSDIVTQKLESLPRRPGVYLMKDDKGKIIYVGKAVDLRQRVRSYFQKGQQLSPKVRAMVERIRDLDYTVTDTEVEALILESNLIKEYRPRYNINLKDDKQYPYLCVTIQEAFPRIHMTRLVEKDGSRYFGPYTNAGAVKETIRLIRRLFPLRHCRGPVDPEKGRRSCLNRHIDRCLAPCTGEVSAEEYRKMVDEILLFLEGKEEKLLRELAARMAEAAENLEFEKAARLRDQQRAVEAITEKQKIVVADGGDRDILALAAVEEQGCVQLFAVRGGKLTGREHFLVTNPTEEGPGVLLAAFLRQYYTHAGDIPPEILLSDQIPDTELVEEWLRRRRGGRVSIRVPQRGSKKGLVRLASDNAGMFLEEEVLREKRRDPQKVLSDLAAELFLDEQPYRIEGYDISHLHGEGTVAAMVVFQNGVPLTRDYRRFRVRTVDKSDDYASLREAVLRRFARLIAAREDGSLPADSDDPFLLVPDLMLIDGGSGQLSAVRQALAEVGLIRLPVVSLAKADELVYLPDRQQPLRLPRVSPALQLLQRVRDEAHRFVVTYQRTLRNQGKRGSTLLDIPGVGEKRRKALLKHFGSIAAMRGASVEELAAVDGLTHTVAATLYAYFHNGQDEISGQE
jgi:excinuclease ABC subunit C